MTMHKDIFYSSCGKGKIHACRWEPEGSVKAIVQIVHGIAEYAQRYEDFACCLNRLGYLVVADDHMGHGQSIGEDTTRGYFYGGWMNAVDDTYQLLKDTKAEFPDVPYILFGHSMGSFMVRTILQRYPDSGICGCVICGTGWMPNAVLKAGHGISSLVCRMGDETKPNDMLQGIVFGGYNKRVEHPRTPSDWLNRDPKEVDKYVTDPLCGFAASAGLLRDMLGGILYIQQSDNIQRMEKSLPVYFIAGGDDPVGNYGEGVRLAAAKFKEAGMQHVSCRIYPLCRHEILNEINKQEVYEDVSQWIQTVVEK